ncbi:MAG: hypothetical protein JWM72_1754 [Actinomycetia bacterium]|nr:hypothetical protein [Actinomycetes bacterium]
MRESIKMRQQASTTATELQWRATRGRRFPTLLRVASGLALLALLGACGSTATTPKAVATPKATSAPTTAMPKATTPAPVTVPAPTTAPAPAETAGQANAKASAAQYLSGGTGFSRQGLIEQLSSSSGEGYSLADATYGVDAQHADWNAQAVLSAKGYLATQPFSRADLIQQLSSASGSGFTLAQAVYGVTGAGL